MISKLLNIPVVLGACVLLSCGEEKSKVEEAPDRETLLNSLIERCHSLAEKSPGRALDSFRWALRHKKKDEALIEALRALHPEGETDVERYYIGKSLDAMNMADFGKWPELEGEWEVKEMQVLLESELVGDMLHVNISPQVHGGSFLGGDFELFVVEPSLTAKQARKKLPTPMSEKKMASGQILFFGRIAVVLDEKADKVKFVVGKPKIMARDLGAK
ncbi:MAG: hypothetical protein ACI8UO_006365 [Verrucomicrobiales bacterium]|jgi:hypothetical protein